MMVSSTRSWTRVFAALLLSAALSGCSIAKLAYNHSDRLMLRKLDAYLDLSPEQASTASVRLRQRLEAHRRYELPDYLDYLRHTRFLIEDGVDADEAEWIIRQGRILTLITLEGTIPVVADTLSDVSQEQIQHLEQHFEKVNLRFRKKYLPSSEREQFLRSVRRTMRRIEHWTGASSEDQKQRVIELRAAFPQKAEEWLKYNVGNQRRLLYLLREDADAGALSEFLVNWWIKLEGRGPSLRQGTDESFEALVRLVVGVHASLDSAQRRFLTRRLNSHIEQIEELIVHS